MRIFGALMAFATVISLEACKNRSNEQSSKDPGSRSAHAEEVAKEVAKGNSKMALASLGTSPQVQLRFEGCRNDGTIFLPTAIPINDGYICPDLYPDPPHQQTYTSGSLGQDWNELDLVPHRLSTSIGQNGVAETYQIAIAADRLNNGGIPGYDLIEAPVLNTTKSDPSCQAPVVSAQAVTAGLQGGASSTIYRVLTITQQPNTTCVFDWWERLALGSHNIPGGSLQSYLFDQGFSDGQLQGHHSDIPINPGSDISLTASTALNAVTNSGHVWKLSSDAPAKVKFCNICDPDQKPKQIKVTLNWEKLAGDPVNVTITSTVAATNIMHRAVQVSVDNKIYAGTTQTTLLGTMTGSLASLGAEMTMNVPMTPSSITAPIGLTNVNNVVTATFTDLVTNTVISTVVVKSTTVVDTHGGADLDNSAVINHLENLTGGGTLKFSTDSVSGLPGAFDGGYVAGTQTIGPVSYTSTPVTNSGSATFNKTIYFTGSPGVLTTGTLTNLTTLTGSDFNITGMKRTSEVNTKIKTDARVTLTIVKYLVNPPSTGSQTFQFHVFNAAHVEVASPTITFNWPADGSQKSVDVKYLAPGIYTVTEDPVPGWEFDPEHSTTTVDLTLPHCTGQAKFTNKFAPPRNKDLVVTKTAVPSFKKKYTWDIKKTVDKNVINIMQGDPATANYSISVTHDNGTDSDWKVNGVITVSNPNAVAFTDVNITDIVGGGGTCVVTNGTGRSVPAGGSITAAYTCTYSSAPTGGPKFTNTATASWDAVKFSTPNAKADGTVQFSFADATPIVIDGSVVVTDTFGGALGTVTYTDPSPKVFTYSRTFTGGMVGACKDYPNTASFKTNTTYTTGSSSQLVKVCIVSPPTVSATATPAFTRSYNWTINKTVDKNIVKQAGGTAIFNYNVKVVETGFTDSGWVLNGNITVTNPSNFLSVTATVSAVTNDGGVCTVASNPLIVPASGSQTTSYTCTYASAPTLTSGNKVTVSAAYVPTDPSKLIPTGTATTIVPYVFSTPTSEVNKTMTVTDTFKGTLGTVTATSTPPFTVANFPYSRTIPIPNKGCETYDNTASITASANGYMHPSGWNGGTPYASSSQSVQVCFVQMYCSMYIHRSGSTVTGAGCGPGRSDWYAVYIGPTLPPLKSGVNKSDFILNDNIRYPRVINGFYGNKKSTLDNLVACGGFVAKVDQSKIVDWNPIWGQNPAQIPAPQYISNAPANACNPHAGRRYCSYVVGAGAIPATYLFEGRVFKLTTNGNFGSTDCNVFDETYSPLVIDLKNAGVTLSAPNAGTFFDLQGDGMKYQYSWPTNTADVGFLTLDINGNGKVDNIGEMFGNSTGANLANGFEALKRHDINRDGFIDAKDPVYAKLAMWSDKNSNGLTEAGERRLIKDVGILKIDLGYSEVEDRIDFYGNFTRQKSTGTMASGASVGIYDIWVVQGPAAPRK